MDSPKAQFVLDADQGSGNPEELTEPEAQKLQAMGQSNSYKGLKKLLPRHHKILDLVLEGWSAREIADQLGMERGSVSMLGRTPLFQDELARRRKQREDTLDLAAHTERSAALDHLQEAALRAAEVQVNLLDVEDPRVQQKAVSEILNRCYGDRKAIQDAGSGGPHTQVILEGPAILNINTAMGEVRASAMVKGDKGP